MTRRRLASDDRGVSESTGVGIMVGFTVLVVASVGVGVLFVDSGTSGPPSANFTFEHFSSNSMLIVEHGEGDPIPAGQVVFEGEGGTATWASLNANMNETTPVSQGAAVQLGPNNAWGDAITSDQNVEVYYVPDPDNRTLLSAWRGG